MIEPAVALGNKPKTDEWPPIKRYDELMVEKLPEPEILIAGILHQGGKLLLGGGSSVNERRCCSLTLRFKSGVSATGWLM